MTVAKDPHHLFPVRPGTPYRTQSYVMLMPGGDLVLFPSGSPEDPENTPKPVDVTDRAVEFLLSVPFVFSPPDSFNHAEESFFTSFGPDELNWKVKGEPALMDLFILFDNNRDTLEPIFRTYWFTEWVDHAMDLINGGVVGGPSMLQFITFRYVLDRYLDVLGIPTDGFAFPEVTIVGFDDADHGDSETMIRYGISPGPLAEFLALPLRMDARLLVDDLSLSDPDNRSGFRDPMDGALDPSDKNPNRLLVGPGSWTLGSVIHGLLHELSFHGNPSMSDEFKQEIGRRVAEIKDGDLKGIPLDEVISRLEARRIGGEE